MKKIGKLLKTIDNVKLICWDVDGTLLDTETMWYNMNDLVLKKYGDKLNEKEKGKASEEIAANAYKTFSYRANADVALNFFKKKGICQIIINQCDLTNQTLLKNENIIKLFPIDKFDFVISEKSFDKAFTMDDMYELALKTSNIKDAKTSVAICDLPNELLSAKKSGMITIWAKNCDYPFTKEELKIIRENADYYVEDFKELLD